MKAFVPLLLLLCSCPSVRMAKGYVLEPSIAVKYYDTGNTTLGDSFSAAEVWLTLRRDEPVSGVPVHPGFLDRHDDAMAIARKEAAAGAARDHSAAALPASAAASSPQDPASEDEWRGASDEMGGLIDAAEHGLQVAENATWAAVGRIIVLLVALAAIGTGIWWVRRWWLTRQAAG